ncbi:hypothetical protein AB1N83_005508 [Pleurotus pulmonarius]
MKYGYQGSMSGMRGPGRAALLRRTVGAYRSSANVADTAVVRANSEPNGILHRCFEKGSQRMRNKDVVQEHNCGTYGTIKCLALITPWGQYRMPDYKVIVYIK